MSSNLRVVDRGARAHAAALALSGALLACAAGCTDADVFVPHPEFGGPAGVVTGAVTYSGPPPCTAAGRVIGAAVLFGFDETLLPPPDGLGTQPTALSIIPGEELFAGIRGEIAFAPSGQLLCPPAGTSVAVSADFALGPLEAGAVQIRGFYDHDGDFDPSFSIFNLPTAGDIGGGALLNAEAVLQGAAPRYRSVGIGELQKDGTRTMPPTGYLVEGVAVTLGLPLSLERPIFRLQSVLDSRYGNTDPRNIVIPSDYQLEVFDLLDAPATEASFIRLVLGAGVDPAEATVAAEAPFNFPTSSPQLLHTRRDVNRDGVIDIGDSIPESVALPTLMPAGLLTKLTEGSDLHLQSPAVVLQAITLLDGLAATTVVPDDLFELRGEVLLALRPTVLCVDPSDPTKPGTLLSAHQTDAAGNVLIADPAAIEGQLSAQLSRPIELAFGCLPQGRYSVNLVYDSGQAWTVPNEAGLCDPKEEPSADGTRCGSRARIASQGVVVTIGPAEDPAYCAKHPTPADCIPAE